MPANVPSQATPIRTKAFQPTCFISGNEIELVTECLKSHNWSSFKGGTEGWDLEECATMPSARAAQFGPTEIRFLGGRYVRQLESEVATATHTEFAVSANSATSALVMALGALDIEPGDEVLVPYLSFNASATAILFYNAVPVFCEIKLDTLCLDPNDLEAKITRRTKAIMVVHFGGNATNMDAVMAIAKKHDLKVIEDCAQSPGVAYNGKPVGGIGDAGIFSFTETKNISCGEGGMLITNNARIAMKARLIRNHGEGLTEDDWPDQDLCNIIGMNFRLTELQAAVAIPQYRSLGERNAIRNENWSRLLGGLAGYGNELWPIKIEPGTEHACHIAYWHWRPKTGHPDRETLIAAMRAAGIPLGVAYRRLMHENPIYTRQIAYGTRGCPWACHPPSDVASATYGTGACPKSEAVNAALVSFKFVNPPNTVADMDDVVAAFRQVIG